MDNKLLVSAIELILNLHGNQNELMRQMGEQKAEIQASNLMYVDADEILEIIGNLILHLMERRPELFEKNPVMDCIK